MRDTFNTSYAPFTICFSLFILGLFCIEMMHKLTATCPQSTPFPSLNCRRIAAFKQYLPHAIFSLSKTQFLSHNPFSMGVQPKLKHSNKHSVMVTVKAIHATKTKITWKILVSFNSFRLYTRKILYTLYLSSVACRTRKKVHSRVISDSDVCEVDLGNYWNELSKRCAIFAQLHPPLPTY